MLKLLHSSSGGRCGHPRFICLGVSQYEFDAGVALFQTLKVVIEPPPKCPASRSAHGQRGNVHFAKKTVSDGV